jgi:hypothetical protein
VNIADPVLTCGRIVLPEEELARAWEDCPSRQPNSITRFSCVPSRIDEHGIDLGALDITVWRDEGHTP